VQVETFTIDHTAPVTDLSLLNPLAFGAAQRPSGSVASSTYPGVGKPGKVEVVSSDTLSGVKTIKTSLDGGTLVAYSNDMSFSPVLFVNQSGDHSLRIVSTDAAGNVKEITKYFTVFGAVASPSPSPKPSPKPTPRCPTALSGGTVTASTIPGTLEQYNVTWGSSGGCAPYRGTITAQVCYPSPANPNILICNPYKTYTVTQPKGTLQDNPQVACSNNAGTYVRYQLALRDSFGQTTISNWFGNANATPNGCIIF
jgi:hypothetical protein